MRKKRIASLAQGDVVFLYRSGEGVVAVGLATGVVDSLAHPRHRQEPEAEWSMKLTDFRALAPAVTAAEVRQAHRPVAFTPAFIPLRPAEGEALYRCATKR